MGIISEERMKFLYDETEDYTLLCLDLCNLVYEKFIDEQSRKLYKNRVLLSVTGDLDYVRKIILSTDMGKAFYELLSTQNDGIYIYGAGMRGQRLLKLFPEYRWLGFVDREIQNAIMGYQVYSLENFHIEKNEKIVISNLLFAEEIQKNLLEMGVSQEQIILLNDYENKLLQNQYFEECVLSKSVGKSGAFIDGGSYDGKDAIRFISSRFYNNNKIFIIEPDPENMKKCKEKLSLYPNIELVAKGVSDCACEAKINSAGESSSIADSGETVLIDTIDNILGDESVSYIKLDIEGFELLALKGAANHIIRDNPVLMISVYHKRSDIFTIPNYILSINSNYRFVLRHYRIGGAADSVLYCVPI